ncbi:2-dehydropantoate 2-reductase [Nocardia stercoris]|uniref:2-dehydropantoate 2-reductase n=1 Tax=Nocardia stercoris TaxID=2483361 RepID=A0A3M2L6F5_9NOCA|nr:2-dehydropantoate 2-reductase [Nocardia stercoris]RMI32310.1 2-dehydropantoate 2-reductase [Nocardia stercoris]
MTVRVCVVGAGCIGLFTGGKLAGAGAEVTFVGRPRVLEEITTHGLRLTDLDGGDQRVEPSAFRVATEPDPAAADLVLVTVKSGATESVAAQLAGRVRPGTVVLSLQNGIGNDEVLRAALPDAVVLAGMVLFNVAHRSEGRYHRGSDGYIAVADDPALDRFAPVFAQAGLALRRYPDLRPVQWAKLLLNLNNPINALSGRTLRDELARRDYRRCLALAQAEALNVMRAAGIAPARLTPIPPNVMRRVLTVPDWLFRRVAGRVLAVDPLASSSMADDLAAGRITEMPWLSGEIIRLGDRTGVPTPVHRRLTELIESAERGDPRRWTGAELLAQLTTAR